MRDVLCEKVCVTLLGTSLLPGLKAGVSAGGSDD